VPVLLPWYERSIPVETKARRLIDGASFGPEALKAIGAAFDAAWAEISNYFGDDTADVKKARLRLADALLSIATEDSREVEVLKRAALARMALDYKRRRQEEDRAFARLASRAVPTVRRSMSPPKTGSTNG
jgi:hypothetical protein